MYEIEIGRGKRGRQAYALKDVSVAPSRRTRDVEVVSTAWQIDAYKFDAPIMSSPLDGVVSPATAVILGNLGILPVFNLEGLWTRYEDPQPLIDEIAALSDAEATKRLQEIYAAAPVREDLVAQAISTIHDGGVLAVGAVSPQHTREVGAKAVAAGLDMLVIRGTTVSAEHVSADGESLNLKNFIYDLDVPVVVGGCATYMAALHLMRAGAAGVLVGFGGGAAGTTADVLGVRVPMATAISDVAAARRDYLDESGGRYVHVIADGSVLTSGDLATALACGADAAMVGALLARAEEAPGRGASWGAEGWHATLPRGRRRIATTIGTFAEILHGPSHVTDGTMNIVGALRKAMATTGYSDIKEFQRVEVIVHPR